MCPLVFHCFSDRSLRIWREVKIHGTHVTHRTASRDYRMVMHISGTFDYIFIVPGGSPRASRRMEGSLTRPPELDDRRLLGHVPILEAVDYQKEDWQLYSRITLTP